MKRYLTAMSLLLSCALIIIGMPYMGHMASPAPSAPADTAKRQSGKHLVQATIHLLARTYGDSVVLRWGAEDYVTQKVLDEDGAMVVRYDYAPEGDDPVCDTLATDIRPWTLKQFQDSYPESDSIALMAAGILYSNTSLKPDQTRNAKGTLGSLMEIYEDQMTRHALRMLIAEWRNDVATHLGMRFVDRKVRRGHQYEYIVQPARRDKKNPVLIASASTTVTNTPYVKDAFDIAVGDSLVGHGQARLWWENRGASSYEVERRKAGDTEWTRVTTMPYWNMSPITEDESAVYDCAYSDVVPEIGDYEYRVFGHDPFGELTTPSPIHVVHYTDMEAPKAPELTLVEIDRQDPSDLSKKVMATFHFAKDSIEDDFVGFMPMYYNPRLTEKKWKKLSDRLLPPTDSVFTCDVTGFSTGMVVVAAYDTAHNVSYSMTRMVQIRDVKAPSMMHDFKAMTSIEDGTVTLTWTPDTLDDDIEYYEVTVANDTTHAFVLATKEKLQECRFVDTLAMDVNQKFIYYKVRAVDYSTNQGIETPPLQVIRPTRLKPSAAHLYQSKVDSMGIHMDWACSNEQIMDHHILLRRLEGQEQWDTLTVVSAERVNADGNLLRYVDTPHHVQGRDYQYCVESFSCSGISSGYSLIFCTPYEGSRLLSIPITLTGRYDTAAKESVLTWDINNSQPLDGDWYVCLYRKGPRDTASSFQLSLPRTTTERRSARLAPGQSEEYSIKVRFRDGRESRMSNTVRITAPE